jgi:hypothetical protein
MRRLTAFNTVYPFTPFLHLERAEADRRVRAGISSPDIIWQCMSEGAYLCWLRDGRFVFWNCEGISTYASMSAYALLSNSRSPTTHPPTDLTISAGLARNNIFGFPDNIQFGVQTQLCLSVTGQVWMHESTPIRETRQATSRRAQFVSHCLHQHWL